MQELRGKPVLARVRVRFSAFHHSKGVEISKFVVVSEPPGYVIRPAGDFAVD
jgi:hypothetical protein